MIVMEEPFITKEKLVSNLKNIGVEEGDVLFIHSSFKSIGKVEGGAQTVIDALKESVGEKGTILMPVFNLVKDRPGTWNVTTTPSTTGYLTEYFRTLPGTVRSDHYSHSVAAWGAHAYEFVSGHRGAKGMISPWDHEQFGCTYGYESPFMKLYCHTKSKILMLGVDYHSSTFCHLVEVIFWNERLLTDQKASYVSINREKLGQYFDSLGKLTRSFIGQADSRLFKIRDFVDTLCREVRKHTDKYVSMLINMKQSISTGEAMKIKIIKKRIISKDNSYHGWPSLCKRKNGQLLVVASGGRQAHVCPFGKIYLYRSDDNGNTWSGPEVLYNSPLDDRDPGILETDNNTLLVSWFTSLTWMNYLYRAEIGIIKWLPEDTCKKWREIRDKLLEDEINTGRELDTWMIRSEDGGKTWSERIKIPVHCPHGPVQLKDGRLLFAGRQSLPPEKRSLYGASFIGIDRENSEIAVAESNDDGKNWKITGVLPVLPPVPPDNFCEPHLVETTSGTLIMHIRNQCPSVFPGEILQSESEDGGKTWSVPHPIGLKGLPAHLLCLHNGWILTTYGYRKNPFGIRASVSKDEGKTWSEPIVISDDGYNSDLGYPSSVQIDDGSIITVWYEVLKDNPFAVLKMAHWVFI
ncbi:MAG TPA: AAC(3) family N-acetyltransferase [bacterium]|nr:AAC(3) family N-acetyltransferase [bacterium]